MTHLDVLIYLSADVSVLAERIKNRNRKIERNIDLAYLSQLNELYENFFLSEIRLLSMKQRRILKQRSDKFEQLKQLCLDLLKTSNSARKITVADRV